MSGDRCDSCRFWQPVAPNAEGFIGDRNYDADVEGQGICRRLPPVGLRRDAPALVGRSNAISDAAYWAQWPVTLGDLDWCGEHQTAEPGATPIIDDSFMRRLARFEAQEAERASQLPGER